MIIYYFGAVLVVGVVTFVFYGYDKRQAKKEGWRVPEARLHLLALCGGWLGAVLGQQFFRHKTQKLSFKLITWLIVIVHSILIFWLIRW